MDEPKVILITGGWRTGSTLCYNIVRQILSHTGLGGRYLAMGATSDEVDKLVALPRRFHRDWFVVKCHCYKGVIPGHVRVIHSHRDLEAAAASFRRISPETPEDEVGGMMLQQWQADVCWDALQHGLYQGRLAVLPFNGLFDLEATVWKVANCLGADSLRAHQVQAIVRELSVATVREETAQLKGADPETEFRPGHITRGQPDGSS